MTERQKSAKKCEKEYKKEQANNRSVLSDLNSSIGAKRKRTTATIKKKLLPVNLDMESTDSEKDYFSLSEKNHRVTNLLITFFA